MADKGTEYEFVLPDGSRRYEIVFDASDVPAFMSMHGAFRASPLRHDPPAPPDERAFTRLEVEAALCMWEHLDLLSGLGARPSNLRTLAEGWRDVAGSVALRHACIDAAPALLRLYDACVAVQPDVFDGFAYDWDVVPAFVEAALPLVQLDYDGGLQKVFERHPGMVIQAALMTLLRVEAGGPDA